MRGLRLPAHIGTVELNELIVPFNTGVDAVVVERGDFGQLDVGRYQRALFVENPRVDNVVKLTDGKGVGTFGAEVVDNEQVGVEQLLVRQLNDGVALVGERLFFNELNNGKRRLIDDREPFVEERLGDAVAQVGLAQTAGAEEHHVAI